MIGTTQQGCQESGGLGALIEQATLQLLRDQDAAGYWGACFETGVMPDAQARAEAFIWDHGDLRGCRNLTKMFLAVGGGILWSRLPSVTEYVALEAGRIPPAPPRGATEQCRNAACAAVDMSAPGDGRIVVWSLGHDVHLWYLVRG